MASKSKDVRIEQLRLFEKKLALRLQQLDQKGISKEKVQRDPLVKSLKSKIRETNVRIAAVEKFIQLNEKLAQAKAQKLAEPEVKKEEKSEPAPEAKQAEPKPKSKKKEETADKEPKKQSAAKDEAPAKEPKKRVAATDEAAPKKTKKTPADSDETAPKKIAPKKKEE
jgi:TolA-binding protein